MLICGDLSDRQAPLSPKVPRERSSHRFQPLSIPALEERLGRSDRRRLAWALRSSASSWQGFLVSPGGAPPPPECPACETRPAGRRTPSRRATKSATMASLSEAAVGACPKLRVSSNGRSREATKTSACVSTSTDAVRWSWMTLTELVSRRYELGRVADKSAAASGRAAGELSIRPQVCKRGALTRLRRQEGLLCIRRLQESDDQCIVRYDVRPQRCRQGGMTLARCCRTKWWLHNIGGHTKRAFAGLASGARATTELPDNVTLAMRPRVVFDSAGVIA